MNSHKTAIAWRKLKTRLLRLGVPEDAARELAASPQAKILVLTAMNLPTAAMRDQGMDDVARALAKESATTR